MDPSAPGVDSEVNVSGGYDILITNVGLIFLYLFVQWCQCSHLNITSKALLDKSLEK